MTPPSSGDPAVLEPWFRVPHRLPMPQLRLICFPHAGGAASFYNDWAKALAGYGIELWAIQTPGRERRIGEEPLTDLAQLVMALVEAAGSRLNSVPYAVYGHSAGAYMGCAFALRMAQLGLAPPRRIFTAASRPPEHPDPDTPIHLMENDALLRKLEGYGGLPRELYAYPELIDMLLATSRADLRLVETADWPPLPWLDCPLTAIGGDGDANVPIPLLPAWGAVTTGAVQTLVVEGGHFPDARATRHLWGVIGRAACTEESGG